MGLFTKKEKTHFERDEEGRVINIKRNGNVVEPKYKSSRQLEREYYEQNPEKAPFLERKRQERIIYQKERKESRKVYREELSKARIKRAREAGKKAGSITLNDRLNNLGKGFSFPSYSTRMNYNPFGSMFDTGINKSVRKNKTNPSTKYTIVNNKAYPIAKSSSKKKKSSKKSSRSASGFDLTDNWGLMK